MMHPLLQKVKEHLDSVKRPFYFFHDDPDGLSSFLLFYRYIKEGKGYPLKAVPHLKLNNVKNVKDYDADHVFILDIAMADQEFIDALKIPVTWIDHHPPQQPERALYFNSRIEYNKNIPTPALCYEVVQQDLWIATVGSIGDWYMPPFAEEFSKKYPELLPKVMPVEEALYKTPVGTLVKVFSFNLKGSTSEVNTSIKILTRIESPYEILQQSSSAGRLLWNKYLKVADEYNKLLEKALANVKKNKLIIFTYEEDKLSLTKDLANELIARHPDKVIILGRRKNGEYRCSLRSGEKVRLDIALQKSLIGIEGYGGGHEQACGAAIKEKDFEQFIDNLKKNI
ncbi:DHH family phosphoesterase [Candidatus Woesearchaeota archaeon]|nr:DHH family phosphoesterase [Candidatus Woesearchaeota archaeon]